MQNELDRRAFLKGSLIASAATGIAAFGLAGCQTSGSSDASQGTSSDTLSDRRSRSILGTSANTESEFKTLELSPDVEYTDYDVVVIGGGTSGTCAALSAAQSGAKTVIVEKTDITGGLANVSGVICGTETRLQKEQGVEISSDSLYTVVRERYKGTSNLPLVRDIFENSADNIDWLIENGLGLIAMPPDRSLQSNLPRFQEQCGHLMQGSNREAKEPNAATEGSLKGLYNTYFEDCNGEIMLNTRAFKLITDETGTTVTGVACAKEDGSQIVLNAKAIVLSAGSWGGNTDYYREVLAHTNRYTIHSMTGASLGNTGDGIYMAEEIGAQRWISMPFWHQTYYVNPDGTENPDMRCQELTILQRMPVFMWVNSEGTRFCDEGVTGDFAMFASSAFSQGGDYWLVLDRATLADLEENGTPVAAIGSRSSGVDNTPRSGIEGVVNKVFEKTGPIPKLVDTVEDFVSQGQAIKAETLEDLASQAGFEFLEFKNSVDVYNEAVATKIDKLFLKNEDYLYYPIASAPFYLFRLITNNEGGSNGGVRVNRDLKVYIKETGKTFSNLFAAGLCSSGFFGYGPYTDIMGMTMGYATGSGRLAGKRAAAIAKK
jgi:fumarate reductase flavoprotein subunit